MGRVSLGPFNLQPLTRQSCDTLAELGTTLRQIIDNAVNSEVPNCTNCELSLTPSALIPLMRPVIGPYAEGGELDLPEDFKTRWQPAEDDLQHALKGGEKKSHPIATVAEIAAIEDPTTRSIVQRAASRGIEAMIENVDSYRYSFNNAWTSKDQEGLRFSYICQDSMQNKDRHANGHARTTKTPKKEERFDVRKPTYDCKGSFSVKCSISKGCVEVLYRHIAIHPTVLERKNMPSRPRPREQSSLEDGGQLARKDGLQAVLQNQSSAFSTSSSQPMRLNQTVGAGSLKRKRDDLASNGKTDSGLSMAELLRRSEEAKAPSKQLPAKQNRPVASGVQYDLPSWEKPPPVLFKPTPEATPYPAPYQPPYTPAQKANARGSHHESAPRVQPTPVPRTAPVARWQPRPSYQPNPSPQQSPQAQGLFMTLKAMPSDHVTWRPPATVANMSYAPPQRQHAVNSCTNCRHQQPTASQLNVSGYGTGEMACDGVRPVCGNCLRSGKYGCQYDGDAAAWAGAQSGGVQMGGNGQVQTVRAESPNPWFPKG